MIETLYQEKAELNQKIEKMLPIVEEGKQARLEVEADALLEYTRMQGEGFKAGSDEEKAQKEFLSLLPSIEKVKNFRNQYAELAEKLYPSGQKTSQPPAKGTDPADDEDNDDGKILSPFEPTADAF